MRHDQAMGNAYPHTNTEKRSQARLWAAKGIIMNTRLWKYNKVTGYWVFVRSCLKETAAEWLAIHQNDDTGATYKLSKGKPKGKP